MSTTPGTERLHEWNEFFTLAVQRIGDPGRHGGSDLACEDAVGFQLAQLLGQNLLRDLGQFLAELGEAARSKGKMPKDLVQQS